jgi:hypothetical protein
MSKWRVLKQIQKVKLAHSFSFHDHGQRALRQKPHAVEDSVREKVPVMTGMSAALQGGDGKTDGCANRG